MGDSLASGLGVRQASNSYVQRLYAHARRTRPGLVLKNFACAMASTRTVVEGPGCGAGSQLGRVTSFLRAPRGHVAFLTIDLGINDVPGLANPDPARRVTVPTAALRSRLTRILERLKSAYPGIKAIGMNYYDPVLSYWLAGRAGRTVARESERVVSGTFNPLLTETYRAAGFRTADVAGLFRTKDFTLTLGYKGLTLPRNVVKVCVWTRMCPGNHDIHANAAGHAVIATAFERVLDADA